MPRDPEEFHVEVKHHSPLPNRYTWQIHRAGEELPIMPIGIASISASRPTSRAVRPLGSPMAVPKCVASAGSA